MLFSDTRALLLEAQLYVRTTVSSVMDGMRRVALSKQHLIPVGGVRKCNTVIHVSGLYLSHQLLGSPRTSMDAGLGDICACVAAGLLVQ